MAGPTSCRSAARGPGRRAPRSRRISRSNSANTASNAAMLDRLVSSDPAPPLARRNDAEVIQLLQSCQQVRYGPAPTIQRHTSTTSISWRRAASSNFSRSCRCEAPLPDLFHLEGDLQPRRAAYSRSARICNGMVCWSLVETRRRGRAEHFRWFPCLAKNPMRFCVLRGLFFGHFRVALQPGRRLSFSARQDLSYSRLSDRLAVIPGHPLRGFGRQFFGVPLQFG